MAERDVSADTILVWGAGAIGGTLGACWARAGHDVLLVDVDAAHVAACAADGIAIEGPVEAFVQPVRAVTPDAVEGTFERVVLAVKAHATPAALDALVPHLADDGYVLSAQNGLEERAIAERVGAGRTMGAFVNFGADWQGPGRILYGNRGAVVVGEIDGSVRDRTKDMHGLLKAFEPDAVLTGDIWGYLWGKLGYGAMLFGTALTGESMSACFSDPSRVPVLIGLAREVVAVAAAEGVAPRGFDGYDPAAFAPGADDAAARACVAELARFTSRTAKTHSGIHRDLAVRKRRTEVDPQVGAVIELARGHGIEVPLLTRLVALIHDVEEGRRPLSGGTFAELAR